MDIVKIVFAAVLTAFLYGFIKQIRPELAPLIIYAGVALIAVSLLGKYVEVSDAVDSLMELSGLDRNNVSLLVRSLGICVITQFASDICRDNSCSSIASAVELAGKIGAVALAMPMIKTVVLIAMELINRG